MAGGSLDWRGYATGLLLCKIPMIDIQERVGVPVAAALLGAGPAVQQASRRSGKRRRRAVGPVCYGLWRR